MDLKNLRPLFRNFLDFWNFRPLFRNLLDFLKIFSTKSEIQSSIERPGGDNCSCSSCDSLIFVREMLSPGENGVSQNFLLFSLF